MSVRTKQIIVSLLFFLSIAWLCYGIHNEAYRRGLRDGFDNGMEACRKLNAQREQIKRELEAKR